MGPSSQAQEVNKGHWVWQCSGRRAQEAGLELREGPVLQRSAEELECWGGRTLVPPRQGQGWWRPVWLGPWGCGQEPCAGHSACQASGLRVA